MNNFKSYKDQLLIELIQVKYLRNDFVRQSLTQTRIAGRPAARICRLVNGCLGTLDYDLQSTGCRRHCISNKKYRWLTVHMTGLSHAHNLGVRLSLVMHCQVAATSQLFDTILNLSLCNFLMQSLQNSWVMQLIHNSSGNLHKFRRKGNDQLCRTAPL